MADQEIAENLSRYGQLFKEAETHVDYWMAVPVIEFTEDLCRIMKEKRVSRAELARRIGTSRAHVTQLLGGGANFTLLTMVKLAKALDSAVHIHLSDKRAITKWRDKKPRKAAKKAAKKPEKTAAKPRRRPAAEPAQESV
jgi:plasmid maintenance system antidote protein VapI